VFTYWAGTWATNLKTNLEANGRDGELVALKPLEGNPPYYDRVPPVWCISAACKNPQAVFDAFIDTMLDGGDTQMLWEYGAEGTHWSRAAETVLAGTDKEATYEEGQFHMKENLEKAGTLYTKNHIDPMLALASFAPDYDDPASVAPEARAASELFNANSRLASIVPATPELSEMNGELTSIKSQIIADVALGTISVEDGYKTFVDEGGQEMSDAIVESLNALN
jgi:putative aldouronate transport system substrate-binding protein